jgi:hypothetical protein
MSTTAGAAADAEQWIGRADAAKLAPQRGHHQA